MGRGRAAADQPAAAPDRQLRAARQGPRSGGPVRGQAAALAEVAAKQAEEIAAARARPATGEERRLSRLGELDPLAFGHFLQLLGEALASWRPGTRKTFATSNDGSMVSAAADAYGAACPPLVRLQGQPSAAAVTLLRHLHEQGATLHYHGDFDWGGLRIATTLLRHGPWRPWRYTVADYRAAATATPLAAPLTGTPAESPWDPALASGLAELGVRVEEESVLGDLLSDLAG
ncbi:DUF2397 family protein [Actinacidiphila oryziradicis]|uniref:DUF2397 family protein n=1 Tax=Actinacidiphila oryziradicis TaxID=2571141 RepID=UPI0023EFBE61|nr:DUF2397 family protein [Actinacidiphila oryziradicis]